MFAVWFTFEKNDELYLSEIISALSKKYNAPVFLPHITVYGLVDIKIDELDRLVLESIKGEKSFRVEKNTISHSDNFWKTLFVELIPNEHLTRINKRLEKSLEMFSSYEFKPHTSLIYKKMTINEREKMTKSIDVKNSFLVNGMCIQEFSEDISKWKIISKYDLC